MSEKKFTKMSDAEIWDDLRVASGLDLLLGFLRPKTPHISCRHADAKPAAEEAWCCKAVRNAMSAGLKHIALASGSGFTFVRVFYCPRCGTKLQGWRDGVA